MAKTNIQEEKKEYFINTYIHELDKCVLEFIEEQPDINPEKGFVTLLYYLNKHLPKIDIKDIDLLNKYFEGYCILCSLFNNHITVIGFCILIGIKYNTAKDWKLGRARSTTHRDSACLWFSMEESYLNKKTLEGHANAYALLKSKFEYRETAPVNLIQNNNTFSIPIPDRKKGNDVVIDAKVREITDKS